MSYILEALKKSSEERSRLVCVAASDGPAVSDASHVARRPARWPVAMIGVGALAVAAYVGVGALRPDDARVAPPAARTGDLAALGDAARTTDAAPAPTPAPTPIPAPAPAQAQAAAQAPAPADAPSAKAKTRPVKDRAAETENQRSVTPSVDVAPPPQQTAAKPAPAVASVAAAQPAAEVRGEMPPELLRQVLAIPISAHIYSSKPAERMVIINGRAVHEGDSLPSGALVEQITPDGISVSFQGYRAKRPVQ